jgi:hypothetical protein
MEIEEQPSTLEEVHGFLLSAVPSTAAPDDTLTSTTPAETSPMKPDEEEQAHNVDRLPKSQSPQEDGASISGTLPVTMESPVKRTANKLDQLLPSAEPVPKRNMLEAAPPSLAPDGLSEGAADHDASANSGADDSTVDSVAMPSPAPAMYFATPKATVDTTGGGFFGEEDDATSEVDPWGSTNAFADSAFNLDEFSSGASLF